MTKRAIAVPIIMALLVSVCAVACGVAPGIATAAETHIFDPVLSLTGGCKTSAVDEVPDPGICPMPPGIPGVDHPSVDFALPRAITTDTYGNLYVASYGTSGGGSQGRIEIFDPKGLYISTVAVQGPAQIAVDSDGVLYVIERPNAFIRLSRFTPAVGYEPAAGEISYPPAPTVIREESDFFGGSSAAIALNPADDHLFLLLSLQMVEYGSATELNPVLDETIGEGVLHDPTPISVAVDTSRGRLYASDLDSGSSERVVRVFELSTPHNLVDTITAAGSPAPGGEFANAPSVAVDEGSGNVFVYDGGELGSNLVYEFDENGDYLTTIGAGKIKDVGVNASIWVDNGANSPNGANNSDGRYLFVPSHPSGVGHAFAFGPAGNFAPEVEAVSVTEVSRSDAELRATINSGNLPTDYVFEYISQQRYEEEGNTFAGATIAGKGQTPASKNGVSVSVAATGLAPDTTYRFRVEISNSFPGTDSAEGQFTTYPSAASSPVCGNEALRTGPSALLPDCRAYELVTPPDTNSRNPLGSQAGFPALQASPAGGKVSFQTQGGTIPGYEGTGALFGDPYLSTRGATGWSTVSSGPNGGETESVLPGSSSPDQDYSIWSTNGVNGSKVVDGKQTNYVRYPDGRTVLVGRGSLDTDPRAETQLISPNGGHIIFVSGTTGGPAIQLEPNAPPAGTRTLYDRTPDEVTHVVSLLPGDVTPAAGHDLFYAGSSFDGEGVVFTVDGTLYLRHDNDETYAIGSGVTFAGVAEGGERVFYLQGGDLKAFDINAGVIDFSTSGDVTPVNVASGGTAAYLVSPSVLGGGPNPNGAEPQAGAENLYLSREGLIEFVGTVTKRDVEGRPGGVEQIEGLGLWTGAVAIGRPGRDPSRSTPDGSVLLFESRADLDDYDPEGLGQVYRYDSTEERLQCLSCNPTGAAATGTGSLESLSQALIDPEPLNSTQRLANIRADGRRAFFQSEEPLVPEDTDGLQDVYQWEDQGVGSCTSSEGCISLISSGQSERIDYLYAVSDSGDDVFIRSSDLLVGADADETPSIYDARVGGGFPEAAPQPCQESQVCRPTASPPPSLPAPASGAVGASGNVPAQPRTCPKGKRRVKQRGKVRCVKKKKPSQRKAGTTKKGGRK